MSKTKNSIVAVGNNVLVREVEAEERSEGGVLIPVPAQQRPPEGEVLGIGPLCFDGREPEFDVGDRVVFCAHAGQRVNAEGEVIKVIRVDDVVGVRR